MLTVKFLLIIILVGALVTAGISQLTPVLAISKQKQQLLDKIFAEEGHVRNATSASSESTDIVKNKTAGNRDVILERR